MTLASGGNLATFYVNLSTKQVETTVVEIHEIRMRIDHLQVSISVS